MATDSPETSSSDIALRYRAPSCVAHRWRLATAWEEDKHTKIRRRFAFLETALHFLVATLAAEYAARRLTDANGWRTLRETLGGRRPTLGLWRDAARDLSFAVLTPREPILEPFASVLVERRGGAITQSAACKALDRLITLRNEDAHPDLVGLELGPELFAQLDEPFRVFLSALRTIGNLPVWVATKVYHDRGTWADVRCVRGLEHGAPVRLELARPLEPNRPFVVGADGSALYLGPMLRWTKFSKRGEELRLFQRWEKAGPVYADPFGWEDPALPEKPIPAGTAPVRWLTDGFEGALVHKQFPVGSKELGWLRDPDRMGERPQVPGFMLGTSLGDGGNGRVFLARRDGRGEQLALKILPAELATDKTARERLRRECEVMRGLSHPNIARVYEFLPDTPAGPVLVMEYIPGENLRSCSSAPLKPHAAVAVLDQVLDGLASAHTRGIVHRDVTPENVICDGNGVARLIDFGIALTEDQSRLTRTLDGIGKVHFAAPEQVEGGDVGAPADVYSAGRVLGYLVSGKADPHEHLGALPGGLQAFYRRAVDPAPKRRFGDAQQMRDALRAITARGWDGPPVAKDEALSDDVRVFEIVRTVGSGIWLLRVRDVRDGDQLVAAVAERREAAEVALKQTIGGLSAAEAKAFGKPHSIKTRDGLTWYRFSTDDIARVEAIFSRVARVAADPRPAAEPRPVAADPGVAERMFGQTLLVDPGTLTGLVRSADGLGPTRSADGLGAPTRSADGVGPTRSLREAARSVAEQAAVRAENGARIADPARGAHAGSHAEPAVPVQVQWDDGSGSAQNGAANVRSDASRAEAERLANERARAEAERLANERAAAERAANERAAAERAANERAAAVRSATPTPRGPSTPLQLHARPPEPAPRIIPTWTLPSRREAGEDALEVSVLPTGLTGLLLLMFPLYWPILLLNLSRAGAVMRAPPPPAVRLPAYLTGIPRFHPSSPVSDISRTLDRLALVVLAQRHVRGAEPMNPELVHSLRTQPLLPVWRVLTMADAAHVEDHRASLIAPRGRLQAQAGVRHVYEALSAGAPALPKKCLWRVNHAVLAMHRLAHAGSRRAPEEEVARVLSSWGVG